MRLGRNAGTWGSLLVTSVLLGVALVAGPAIAVTDVDSGPELDPNARFFESSETVATPALPAVMPSAELSPSLSGSSFDPRFIISDSQFYKRDAMSESEIQNFLDQKIGSCLNSLCLNVLRADTNVRTNDRNICLGYQPDRDGSGNELLESAARILYKVQQSCGISARVLLVTLQKEQGLVTNRAPSTFTLGRAMGYACPDNTGGVCDASYNGFFNQVYTGAWQLHRYSFPTPWGQYQPGPPLAIKFHPNSACGTVGIAIQNNATAALYNYTPYVPNAAALNNLYSTGDACSSYGNRNFWVFYSQWFGSPTKVELTGATVTRIGGLDRTETSVQISEATGRTTSSRVYIANGYNFPDALGAGPAAIVDDAALLLVSPSELSESTREELVRLNPAEVIILGAQDSVSENVEVQIAQATGVTPTRLAGSDRYATSRLITEWAFSNRGVSSAYIATGEGFPDALSASAIAGERGVPLILVPGSSNELDAETRDLLSALGIRSVVVLGGQSTVSTGIESALRELPGMTVERIGGANRFETSRLLVQSHYSDASQAIVTSGRNFPDALSGATLAAARNAPLYLVEPYCLHRATVLDMIGRTVSSMVILGREDSIAPSVAQFSNCD